MFSPKETTASGGVTDDSGRKRRFGGVLAGSLLLKFMFMTAGEMSPMMVSSIQAPSASPAQPSLQTANVPGEASSLPVNRVSRAGLFTDIMLLPFQKRSQRTGRVKTRYFKSRVSYSANWDATRQRGRLSYIPPAFLAGDIELNPGPTTARCNSPMTSRSILPIPDSNTCAACTSVSIRKAAINCSICGERWHTSCAKLTLAQAQALDVWHCSICRGSDSPSLALATTSIPSSAQLGNHSAANTHPSNLAKRLSELRSSCSVIRRIPKAARASAADCLSKLISTALAEPSADTWERFLSFAFVALRAPPENTGDLRPTTATAIKRQVVDMELGSQAIPVKRSAQRKSPPEGDIARRVHSKCADGDIKAALRTLTSNEDFVRPTTDIMSALRRKHPPTPPDETLPPAPHADDTRPLQVSAKQVRSAIESMPTGSSAGLDGIRPLHLRQLISAEASEPGRRLLSCLTSLTNLALDGRIPDCAREAYYGATLCALRKKDGGLRPIAIGSVYRRLSCRIAAHHAAGLLAPDFRPVQLGVGTRQGCEVAVHATREFISARSNDYSSPDVLVKVDVRNAFNSVRRDVILKSIRARCPEIYPIAFQAYSAPTPLHIGDHTIWSCAGVQQGDPLGPVGFSLAVDDCARSMTSPLNVWYLDDATLAGPADVIVKDLSQMQQVLPKLGLELNSAKCEVTVLGRSSDELRTSVLATVQTTLPGIKETPLDQLSLLGSPLNEAGTHAAQEAAAGTVSVLCERIRALDPHSAMFFLAHHTSAPRLQYLLRSSPMYKNRSGLQTIDEMVRSTLADVCNVSIEDKAWVQAALPTKHGGLGVRSVEKLALPCYVASLTAATPLISTVIPTILGNDAAPSALKPAQDCFVGLTGLATLPDPSVAGQQRVWDDAVSTVIKNRLISGVNQVHRARLLASCQPHTAAWLQAIPVPSLGLHLDPETVRIAVALRIGAPICEPHSCRLCNRPVGRLGHHALSCKKSAGRFPRHAELNDLVKRSLSTAGIPSVLEPLGLDRGDGKRPDGLTTFPFKGGRCLAWDATCTDTFADSNVAGSASQPGTAARAAETRKVQRYRSISSQYLFAPLAVETSGVFGPAATRFIKELGRMLTSTTGDKRQTSWLWQRFSIAIVRGNAAAIRGSAPLTALRSANTQHSGGQAKDSHLKNSIPDYNQLHSSQPTRSAPSLTTDAFTETSVQMNEATNMTDPDSPSMLEVRSNECDIQRWVRSVSRASQYLAPTGAGVTLPAGVTGLENLGNTCYMNTVLQVLAQTQDLINYMASESLQEDLSRNSPSQGQVAEEVARLLKIIWSRQFW